MSAERAAPTSMVRSDALARPLDDVLAAFREDGYARVGAVANDDALSALRARADALMLGEVRHEGLFFQHDAATGRYDDLTLGAGWVGPSLEYRKLEKLERDPIFLAWIENPVFERIARAVIDDDVVLYRAVLMTKGASGGTELPWHQDGGTFWGLDRAPTLQIWTALDDASLEAGCVEVMPRTHHDGLATPLGGVIPQEHVRAKPSSKTELLPAAAGEVLLLHNHVWHRSGRNLTGRPRRALSVCYMSASTRCLRKKRAPRTFWPVFRAPSERAPG